MDIRGSDAQARALMLAVVAASILLAVSQFLDYRTIEAGTGLYEGFEDVVRAASLSTEATGEPHAYLWVPGAIASLAILGLAIARRRWALTRLITLIAVAALIVAFAVDMPAGLDEGTAARDFADAEARLLAGFWLEVIAAAVLAVSSFLLGNRRSKP